MNAAFRARQAARPPIAVCSRLAFEIKAAAIAAVAISVVRAVSRLDDRAAQNGVMAEGAYPQRAAPLGLDRSAASDRPWRASVCTFRRAARVVGIPSCKLDNNAAPKGTVRTSSAASNAVSGVEDGLAVAAGRNTVVDDLHDVAKDQGSERMLRAENWNGGRKCSACCNDSEGEARLAQDQARATQVGAVEPTQAQSERRSYLVCQTTSIRHTCPKSFRTCSADPAARIHPLRCDQQFHCRPDPRSDLLRHVAGQLLVRERWNSSVLAARETRWLLSRLDHLLLYKSGHRDAPADDSRGPGSYQLDA